MKPKLLDLFCGAGGASRGYQLAGFDVTGVDIKPQPHYAGDRFVMGDALEYAAAHGHEFDAIHASPPCQFASSVTPNASRGNHLNLIPATRSILRSLGKLYVIENVAGAIRHLEAPIMLCGTAFDLKVYRHRFFESNILLLAPSHAPHHDKTPSAGHGISPKGFLSVTSSGYIVKKGMASQMHRFISPKGFISVAGHFSQVKYARFAMGIEWMTQHELGQAIPPAYTQYVGLQLLRAIGR